MHRLTATVIASSTLLIETPPSTCPTCVKIAVALVGFALYMAIPFIRFDCALFNDSIVACAFSMDVPFACKLALI